MTRLLTALTSLLTILAFLILDLPGAYGEELAKKPTEGAVNTANPVSFTKQIKPVLGAKCVHCHNQETLPDHISFENAKLAFAASKEGKVYIVPGKPEASLMIASIEAPLFHDKKMPMVGEKLTAEEKGLFRRWVAEGAPWPAGAAGKIKVTWRPLE